MWFLWLYFIVIVFTVFFSICTIISTIIFFPFSSKLASLVARIWSKSILFFGGFKYEIKGLEKLDKTKSYIFAANHSSSLDIPLMIACLPYWLVPIAKIQLKRVPFLGWAMIAGGHVFVDRTNNEKAIQSIESIKVSLTKRQRSILLFPEGTRTLNGKLNIFKSGGLSIGLELGIPIVPVAIKGTYEALSKGSRKIKNSKIELLIGPPIETAQFNKIDRKNLSSQVQAHVKALGRFDVNKKNN